MIYCIGRSRLHRNRANLIQTLHTAAALKGLGLETTVLLPPWHGFGLRAEKLKLLGIDPDLPIRASRLLHSRWGDFSWFVRLNKYRLRAAQGVHVRSPELSLALAKGEIPHNLEIHDVEALRGANQLSRLMAAHREGVVRRLFPINGAARDSLLAAGADPERVRVSPSGYDDRAFASIAPCEHCRPEGPAIVHLGLISRERGLDIFLAAAAHGCDVTLVGDAVDPFSASPRLRHVPPVPLREVPAWYSRGDIVLLPYQQNIATAHSMSPIKLFEALAAGRPIIASDLPAIREIINDGENGLLVSPGDIPGWLSAIDRLCNEPDLAARLSAAALRDAQSFTWRQRALGIAQASGWLPASEKTAESESINSRDRAVHANQT